MITSMVKQGRIDARQTLLEVCRVLCGDVFKRARRQNIAHRLWQRVEVADHAIWHQSCGHGGCGAAIGGDERWRAWQYLL